MNLFSDFNSVNQEIDLPLLHEKEVRLVIKREDLIDDFVSGNKFRKLKYNLLQARDQECETILTFGGGYSNHIAAVAKAGKLSGFNTIGIIRGEELVDKVKENPTLSFAVSCGMQLVFVSREKYRRKTQSDFLANLNKRYQNAYIIPEGGTNSFAIKGCERILKDSDFDFTHIATPVGTGGTIAGIVNCSKLGQQVLGFPALKGDFLKVDISNFTKKRNWSLVSDYHFGGYAKVDETLINFINTFKKDTKVPLDPVYTGKMIFGLIHMIRNDHFKSGASILAVHTGGLQGITGMNKQLRKKGMVEIK
ncbi:1-aminocyclopropane-1-carboxylate deaminase/D-cysteine desulfhydrase [Spongiivirga citrea]|uniref:Pyridoxal-phosphate dependent enzyme n=1 Tax=Spongiivirga citrea TaxID=1481457 RepID=A0A6M0CLG5_9FLAO|nr:pyridoxal-phosphate dependent enzyme [Spongiivirga citrea]NER18721.1 pyridoxal-phosphate dependent enzyme [Spongiivirga citrea]